MTLVSYNKRWLLVIVLLASILLINNVYAQECVVCNGNKVNDVCCNNNEILNLDSKTCELNTGECRKYFPDIPKALCEKNNLGVKDCNSVVSGLSYIVGSCSKEIVLDYDVRGFNCQNKNFEQTLRIARHGYSAGTCYDWVKLESNVESNNKVGKVRAYVNQPGIYAIVYNQENCLSGSGKTTEISCENEVCPKEFNGEQTYCINIKNQGYNWYTNNAVYDKNGKCETLFGDYAVAYYGKDQCGFQSEGACCIPDNKPFKGWKFFNELNKNEIKACKIEKLCPDEFILDKGDISYITNIPICKPKIMNMVASDNINDYLSDKIWGTEVIWDNWKNYPPLVNKVNELTAGKTNDFEKVKAVANWVHKSKDYACPNLSLTSYCTSPANNNSKFSDIFNIGKGVCFDAAVITTAMLRTIGIPSYPMFVDGFHAVTLYYLEGKWYVIDTTFCIDKTNCRDLDFMSPEEAKQRVYFVYNRIGHFNEEGIFGVEGTYCENNFCIKHPFVTNKIMPLNDKSNQATVIYPAIRNTYVQGNQIFCSLEFKNMICDTLGCFFSDVYGDKWNTKLQVQYEIGDMRNVGYNRIVLPTRSENLDDKIIYYRFTCKQLYHPIRTIAYKEFTLTPNNKFIITYKDLTKSVNATNEEFNDIKNIIKLITADLGINPE